jgi:hypothetical protein
MDWAILVVAVLTCLFAGGTVWLQLQDRRPGLANEQDEALLSLQTTAEDLRFYVSNTGARPIRLESVWIRFKGDRLEDMPGTLVTHVDMQIHQGPSVPGWLNPGESITFHADLSHVAAHLQSLGQQDRGTVYLSFVDGLLREHKQEVVIPISGSRPALRESPESPGPTRTLQTLAKALRRPQSPRSQKRGERGAAALVGVLAVSPGR